MSFSINTFLFVSIVFLLFYLFKRARAFILLVSSLLFVFLLDKSSFIWIVAVTTIVYLLGIVEGKLLEKKRTKALWIVTVSGVSFCALMLFVLKNVAKWRANDETLVKILLPIGFSYYIFQAISYLVDVCRAKTGAEKNIIHFALYMCYFPKFVSGPIERAENFLGQVKKLDKVRLFDSGRISISFATILYGYFMKVVIADRLAFFTTRLLNEPARFGALWLFFGMLMYTLQIYCDFAGYSAVAVGISKLFGVELTENFHAPYLSKSVGEFWRKWHISLSMWLRDYIYIPLGGSRKGTVRRYINTMVVFVICGIWHGADASFLAWGIIHGLYMIVSGLYLNPKKKEAEKKVDSPIVNIAEILATFLAVSFAWIFFGAPNLSAALCYIGRMLSLTSGVDSFAAQMADIGASRRDIIIPVYGGIVLLFDILIVKKNKRIGMALQSLPVVVRYSIFYCMIIAIFLLGIFGPGYDASSFMYVNF